MKNYKGKRRYGWLKAFLALCLVGVLCFGTLLGAILHGDRDTVQGDPKVMIILGCSVKPWGPSILLQDRLNKALDYLEEHPDITVIVSGGQGADEPMTEAQAMHDFLVENGVDAQSILQEDQSYNTFQNLTYSLELLEEAGYDVNEGVIVVSNGFHLTRIRMLWTRLCGDNQNLSTLAAPSSHVPSRLKMFIREPIGLVKSFILDR